MYDEINYYAENIKDLVIPLNALCNKKAQNSSDLSKLSPKLIHC